jgi:hypothetical protein
MTEQVMPTRRLEFASRALSLTSIRRFANPYTLFEWPEKPDADRFAMSASLTSLFGHPALSRLDDEARWRYHLLEAVHFFSLNIAGEREQLTGLARRLHTGPSTAVSEYMQHVLHEENAHSVVFARFCRAYAGTIYPGFHTHLPREYLPGEEDITFFSRILIFEEVATYFNVQIAADDSVWSLARQINAYHAQDEARHIAFGRRVVEDLWDTYATRWSEEDRARVSQYLRNYLTVTMRGYANPHVYRQVGIEQNARLLREEVLASATRQAVHDAATRRTEKFFRALGVFT